MKYIKTFEILNTDEPQIGDYVICDGREFDTLSNKIENNIGKIVNIDIISKDHIEYYVIYPGNTEDILFWKHEIKYWSKNKKDLEVMLKANKYNL